MPKKIAMPPSRGIGLTFSRRALGPVDDAEQARHPADGRRQQDDDHQRERGPVEHLGVVAQLLGHRAAYFVPYRRSPASPSPGTM